MYTGTLWYYMSFRGINLVGVSGVDAFIKEYRASLYEYIAKMHGNTITDAQFMPFIADVLYEKGGYARHSASSFFQAMCKWCGLVHRM